MVKLDITRLSTLLSNGSSGPISQGLLLKEHPLREAQVGLICSCVGSGLCGKMVHIFTNSNPGEDVLHPLDVEHTGALSLGESDPLPSFFFFLLGRPPEDIGKCWHISAMSDF